ncbi:MAG: ABC transporter ATP-binding protein [Mariprofundaceae bacterium]|nr:ABC transporter ATP-binding protein [Mariprofundaceae bacterium]
MTALTIKDLNKVYESGKQALQNVSLTVPKGVFFALLGPNGAGKSTLINILADTVRASSGSVSLLGHDLLTERAWGKRHLGVVPQEIAFDPFFSPREILHFTRGMYGQKRDEAWVNDLLERLELSEHANKITRQLSGGMKRRLLVAQALVHRPKVVILDEPTAGVDVELRKRLWDFIRELNAQGTTVLLTTHYLEEAQELCDHVAIINQGQVIASQSMQSLLGDVASSNLCCRYEQPVKLLESQKQALQAFAPRVCDGVLCLNLQHQEGQSNFDAAYQAARQALGVPLDTYIRQENLEDVFLRLTHKDTR